MNERAWLILLRSISLICNGMGFVIALAFLLGPKRIAALSRFFDRGRPSIRLESILKSKARIVIGFILLIITASMLFLVLRIKI